MKRIYGASPIHLVAHVAGFALAGFAILQIVDIRGAGEIAIWFLAAIVLHDMVVLPAYTALDRAAKRVTGPAIVYLRVPAALSALLLLVYFPIILGKGDGAFRGVSGQEFDGYATRWLLVTGLLFAGSLAAFLLKGRRSAARRPPAR